MPQTTATDVASNLPSGPSTWIARRKPTTGPLSARIVSQASVLMRYVMKNGAITSSRNRFFQRPPRKAIQYASG